MSVRRSCQWGRCSPPPDPAPDIGGWTALKDLFRRIVLWRVGWVWYLVVLAGPVVLTLRGGTHQSHARGEAARKFRELPDPAGLAARFVFFFLWIGLGEEPGWRGFVLPRLLVGAVRSLPR